MELKKLSHSLHIVHYPHPTLRRPSKPLQTVDAELVSMIREMFELMYEEDGIGLAANQVDLPYRLFVANQTGDPDLKDEEHVFINPVLSERKGMAELQEGCLSLPGLFGQVKRPELITVNAYNLQGEEIRWELSGLLARIVQHESDHLDGVLFIDRVSPTSKMSLKEQIEELETEFAQRREIGEIPSDKEILARLIELEKKRT